MSEDDGDRSGGPVSRISVSLPPDLLRQWVWPDDYPEA